MRGLDRAGPLSTSQFVEKSEFPLVGTKHVCSQKLDASFNFHPSLSSFDFFFTQFYTHTRTHVRSAVRNFVRNAHRLDTNFLTLPKFASIELTEIQQRTESHKDKRENIYEGRKCRSQVLSDRY